MPLSPHPTYEAFGHAKIMVVHSPARLRRRRAKTFFKSNSDPPSPSHIGESEGDRRCFVTKTPSRSLVPAPKGRERGGHSLFLFSIIYSVGDSVLPGDNPRHDKDYPKNKETWEEYGRNLWEQ
jgi:hypothetical protein